MKKKISIFSFVATLLMAFMLIFYLTPSDAQEDSFKLLVFGDSLSSGYKLSPEFSFYVQLENALHNEGYNNVRVINGSKAGETTAGGLNRVKDIIEKENPHAVLVELGANDLLQGLSLTDAKSNLDAIIAKFIAADVPVMLIGMQVPEGYSVEQRQIVSELYADLAKRHGLVFYPNFMEDILVKRFGVVDFKYLLPDGIHPNAEGVSVMVKKVMPTVRKFLNQF